MLKLQLRIDSQQKSRTGTEAAQRNVAVIGKGKAALKSGGLPESFGEARRTLVTVAAEIHQQRDRDE
ncbi:hypothetical protein OJAV_G00208460 [Oryzias javanicus]|uniref:Uncharacterized protein n=1 Tax=Oryzias javanicus TaxID=123683 RepID=A0A3S2PD84_ORYJA|nr:hypothetical protein OJAV_G00208460 [Oryzias javanicus]